VLITIKLHMLRVFENLLIGLIYTSLLKLQLQLLLTTLLSPWAFWMDWKLFLTFTSNFVLITIKFHLLKVFENLLIGLIYTSLLKLQLQLLLTTLLSLWAFSMDWKTENEKGSVRTLLDSWLSPWTSCFLFGFFERRKLGLEANIFYPLNFW